MANNNNKGKNVIGTSGSDQNRASWSATTTTLFLQLLVDEKNNGNWVGKSASKKGYENVSNFIYRQTGIDYNKVKLKSKFDSLRSLFHMWTNLFNGQTGAGYDYATGNMTMPEGWWETKIRENEAYKRFKNGGLENAELMYCVFGDSSATGMYQYTPTAVNPNFDYNFSQTDDIPVRETSPTPHNHAYENEENNSPIHTGEGSARSIFSGQKRKSGSNDSWNASMESLTNALISSNAPKEYVVKFVEEESASVQQAMDILYAMPNLSSESDLFLIGLQLMGDKEKRAVFLKIRDNDTRLRWLKMNERLFK